MRALGGQTIVAAIVVAALAASTAQASGSSPSGAHQVKPAGPTAEVAQGETPGILYSVDANGARVTKSKRAKLLSLPARATVTWFTDRPARRAGSIPLSSLATIWDASGFAADPPNAALILQGRGSDRTHVVELTQPRKTRKRVSFRISQLPDGQEAGYTNTHQLRTGSYRHARLFIDDAALPACNRTILAPAAGTTPPPLVQCLLAPGNFPSGQMSVGSSSNRTIVSACASGVAYSSTPIMTVPLNFTLPSGALAPVVYGCETSVKVGYSFEALVGTYGFDAANAPFPQPNPASPSETFSYCPNPSNGTVSFSNPTSPGVTLRVSVQYGYTLSCPYTFMYYSTTAG